MSETNPVLQPIKEVLCSVKLCGMPGSVPQRHGWFGKVKPAERALEEEVVGAKPNTAVGHGLLSSEPYPKNVSESASQHRTKHLGRHAGGINLLNVSTPVFEITHHLSLI